MMAPALWALMSHWWRNPIQFFAVIGGLALATALWCGVQAINAEARASYDAAAGVLGEGQYDQLVPRTGDTISVEDYIALRRAGWLVTPVVEHRFGAVRLLGIDPLTAPAGFAGLSAFQDQSNSFQRHSVFANAKTAETLSDELDIVVQLDVADGLAIADISVVQSFAKAKGLSRLIILPNQPMTQPLLEEIAPGLKRLAANQTADVEQLTDSFHLSLTAFGMLSFVVGLFIVHSAIGLAFEQRRGLVRTMRSLGVPMRRLLVLVAVEMGVIALIGGTLGVLLGYLIAATLLPDVAGTLQGLYGAQVSGVLEFRASWAASGIALALAGTAFAVSGRLLQIAQMPLLASGKSRAWVMARGQRSKIQGFLAVALLISAAILAGITNTLFLGFGLLACLLVGAALAFPLLVSKATQVFERRSKNATVAWFWADTRQQIPGLSLALMALLLAVSANIGVATMVSSFRLTFVGFLDQRLAPELYLQVDTKDESAALDKYLTDRGFESLPLPRADIDVQGEPARLLGVRVGPTYRQNWVFLDQIPDPWTDVKMGKGLIVNEQLARRQGLWVGHSVTLRQDLALPIVAVVGDYGNPSSQAIVSESLFADLHPQTPPLQFGVRTNDPQSLRTALVQDLGLAHNAMINQAQIKSASLEIFERTFMVTAALNVLTLGVAGFAILMSLLTLADIRVPQLAPVWAMGMTRRRLALLELARAVSLAALVFAAALPVGLALAWVLLTVVNVAAFGWQLPMFLFPAEYAGLAAYTLIAAVLAALWPVGRLLNTPPAALLQVFSNER